MLAPIIAIYEEFLKVTALTSLDDRRELILPAYKLSAVQLRDRERPEFGTLLRRLRITAHLSQEALAERARISVQAVSSLERGVRQAPHRQTLDLLAIALGLEGEEREAFERAAVSSAKAKVRAGESSSEPAAAPWLPTPATSFLGRDNEVPEIVALLETNRVVTLWGAGGVGKTRLAIEAATAARGRFAGGVFFVELAAVLHPSGVVAAVAAALNIAERPNTDLTKAIVAEFAGAHALIVLDNCEHLIGRTSQLAETLIGATGVTLLCTSREPLRVAGERVYDLEPLPWPQTHEAVAAMRSSATVRLFLDRAASAGIDAGEDDDEIRSIATTCRRLDGIPLAIELAAARLASMTPKQIAEALDDRFHLLTRGNRTAPSRQQTLAGALDWSFDLLTVQEQVFLRRLAVLIGTWTLDDAWFVAGEHEAERWVVADLIADLIDKAMVVAAPSPKGDSRYRMLETTREYALIKLREAGELEEQERRHAEHVRAGADAGLAAVRSGADDPYTRLDPDNVRAALHWSITRDNDPALGAALAAAASGFWDALGFQVEGLRWIELSIAILAGGTSPAAVNAWLGKSLLAGRLELHHEARAAAGHAVTLADRGGEPALRGLAHLLSAYAAARLGDHDDAAQHVDEAATIYETAGIAEGMSQVLHARAFAAFRRGRPSEARDALDRLVVLYRTDGTPRSRRNALHATIDLAEAEFGLGNRFAAIAHVRAAIETARDIRAQWVLSVALCNLAAYLLDARDIDRAAAAAHEACFIAFEHRYSMLMNIAVQHCTFVAARRGALAEATLLAGYVEQTLVDRGTRRDYTEQRAYDEILALLHASSTQEELGAGLAAGSLLTEAAAAQVALRVSAGTHELI